MCMIHTARSFSWSFLWCAYVVKRKHFFVRNLFQSSPVWTQEYPILSCLLYFLISQQKTYRSIYAKYIGGIVRTFLIGTDKTAPLIIIFVHFYLFLSSRKFRHNCNQFYSDWINLRSFLFFLVLSDVLVLSGVLVFRIF